MLSRGSPNVDMPKAAIKYLVDSDNAGLNYQKKQSTDLGRYLSNGGDPYQFEGWYAKSFPLSAETSKVHLPDSPKPEVAPKKYSDADINYTAMKYGLTVTEVKKRLGLK